MQGDGCYNYKMKSITSSRNPIFKELKAIATTSKARREYGQTLLEGLHLSQSYLDKDLKPEMCIIGESSAENTDVAAIIERCEALGVQRLMVTDSQMKALSSVVSGVGLLLLVAVPASELPANLETSALLLDDIQDPGNMGAILRTAAAAGIREIYCSAHAVSVWSPKVLRAGMGAHFNLNIYENSPIETVITSSKVPVYATTLQATATLYEVDLSGPTAWVLGNEGRGVSQQLLDLGVKQVFIPQTTGVESLNVAAATAVCLFEQRRQSIAS